MHPIRVLVVEDSVTTRRFLVDILESEPGFHVVGEASDADGAFEMCRKLRPSVVTMDLILADRSNGLTATERIMAHCPTPILLISGSQNHHEAIETCSALAAGAADTLGKPSLDTPIGEWRLQLIAKLRTVSRIRAITHMRPVGTFVRKRPIRTPERTGTGRLRLLAIGASTGGPKAVVDVLGRLPSGFPLPVLLVLHLEPTFEEAFAVWLGSRIGLRVELARDGMQLDQKRSFLLLAPAHHHLIVRNGRLRLTDEAERHSCRPSIDVLFESIAAEGATEVIACLLTGMGRDGAAGLCAIHRAGGLTLVQDEATSVVFGMPAEAIRLGAASKVLPIDRFADVICSRVKEKHEGGT